LKRSGSSVVGELNLIYSTLYTRTAHYIQHIAASKEIGRYFLYMYVKEIYDRQRLLKYFIAHDVFFNLDKRLNMT
jgi:hypothetical protein